jgi:hypothetical protein
VLLTRSRLCPRASPGSSLHLHVLSTPPAFVLSQDQTLRERFAFIRPRTAGFTVKSWKVVVSVLRGVRVHVAAHLGSTGSTTQLSPPPLGKPSAQGRTWTRPRSSRTWSHMLLSFQRPPRPGAGTPPFKRSLHMRKASVEAQRCSPVLRRKASRLASPWSSSSEGIGEYSAAAAECQPVRTRTKRRLPTCSTAPSRRSAGRSSVPASSGSPSSLTPPCASRRRPSDAEIPKASRSRPGR